MRLYSFTHFMLSPMAKGIQATHSTVELFNKYSPENGLHGEMLYDWSKNHKTMISLNGGVTPDMHDLVEFLEYGNCPYPWAPFLEDESLGELLTSISLVLPERIYETAELVRKKMIGVTIDGFTVGTVTLPQEREVREFLKAYEYTEFDRALIIKLNSYRMASV